MLTCDDACGGHGVSVCDPHGAYASCEIFGACACGASGACGVRVGRVFLRGACAFLRACEACGVCGAAFGGDDAEEWRTKRASG